jgi:hypothetical protein
MTPGIAGISAIQRPPAVLSGWKQIARYLGTRWNRPDGAQEAIEIVGFNPDGAMGGPWNLVQGSVRDLQIPGGVILDELYKKSWERPA